MADMRIEDKNNQAREVVFARSKVYATSASGQLFNLPVNSVVTKLIVVVTVADTNASAAIGADINGTTVGSANITATGIKAVEITDIAGYAETGGVLSITPTSTNGDGVMFIIAEIVENNTDGTYLG